MQTFFMKKCLLDNMESVIYKITPVYYSNLATNQY